MMIEYADLYRVEHQQHEITKIESVRLRTRVAELEASNKDLREVDERHQRRIAALSSGLYEVLGKLFDRQFETDWIQRMYDIAAGRAEAEAPATPSPQAQHDPGAHIFMREAVEALREQRDAHGNKADPYDRMAIVARNLRDAYEWLWPLLWRDDPEFVPFAERKQTTR